MSSTLTSQIVPVGNKLKTWLGGEISSLNLKSFNWHRHMRDEPSYPANPRVDCPRGFLRIAQAGHVEGEGGLGCNTAGFVYQISVWLQLLQTPGQEHQYLLGESIDVIHTAIIRQGLDLTEVLDMGPVYRVKVNPLQSPFYSELEHEFNDPQLRVSVAETSFTLTGELREDPS